MKLAPRSANSATFEFDKPTRDSSRLVRYAVKGLERIYRDGYAYQRAGVLLLDLGTEKAEQGLLFASTPEDGGRSDRLMDALDRINRKMGRHSVCYAGEGLGDRWKMRQRLKSEASTTDWAEVASVKAD